MTSQLILGNGFGIALASDSAITGGSGPHIRTYETSEKIHPLGDPHRLAVLHSGRAHFLRLPVGVLVDEWKGSLGSRLTSVEGYRDNFLVWLDDNLDGWTTSSDREFYAFEALEKRLWNLGRQVLEEIAEIPAEQHHDITLATIRETNEMLAGWEINDAVLMARADDLLGRWGEEGENGRPSLASSIEHFFDGAPLSEEIDQEIHRFLKLTVEGGYEFPSDGHTWIYFVGYGQKEMIPKAAAVVLFGALGNHAARSVWLPHVAEPHGGSYALIEPIAQTELIDQIFTGLNRPLLAQATTDAMEHSEDPTESSAQDTNPDGNSEIGTEVPEEVLTENLRDKLMTNLGKASNRDYVEPALTTLAGMPLATLAEVAGSLVKVQNLILDIRGRPPTVGGNIDIATITLSEGFKWVNHKGLTQQPFLAESQA